MITITRKTERGQILAIVALGMISFLLAVGLVLDTGIGFMNRRDAQNIADLSAMAGTKTITDHYVKGGRTGADVSTAIDAIAATNGCAGSCTWTATYVDGAEGQLGTVTTGGSIPSHAQGVQVAVTRHPETFFMRIIGQTTLDVGTSATALTASSPDVPPGVLLPIGMAPPTDIEPGDVYDITDGRVGPGNFGWLSWTGANDAGTLTDSICTPDNPELTVPVNIEGGPGTMNRREGRDCLDEYIANGTTVLIPIWDGEDVGNGSHSVYHIIGFAAFILTSRSQPAVDNIQGVFQRYYPLATVPAGFDTEPEPGDPTYFLALIR
jgi:Flp pilus assembly protein TadG